MPAIEHRSDLQVALRGNLLDLIRLVWAMPMGIGDRREATCSGHASSIWMPLGLNASVRFLRSIAMVPFPTLFVMVSAGFMMAALATLLDHVSSLAVAARPNPV